MDYSLINKAGPKKHPWITEEERKFISEGQSIADQNATDDQKGLSLKEILSYKESWAIVASRFFLEPIWWLFVGWMPIYLFDVYGFNVKEVGMFAWVPYVGAAIGNIICGHSREIRCDRIYSVVRISVCHWQYPNPSERLF